MIMSTSERCDLLEHWLILKNPIRQVIVVKGIIRFYMLLVSTRCVVCEPHVYLSCRGFNIAEHIIVSCDKSQYAGILILTSSALQITNLLSSLSGFHGLLVSLSLHGNLIALVSLRLAMVN